tara:strand:+ start:129 stop:347 length:219 start_codon:yes stop_codon:yes gene_type:complete
MEFFSFITALPEWLNALCLLVSGATAITALTPSKVDDHWAGKATGALNGCLRVMNVVAGNIALNKNADEEKK